MGSAPHVQEGSMGNTPYVHSCLPGVLFTIVAWDGECSLSKGPGSWARYPVEDGAMGSAPYVQSLSPILLSIQVASDGEPSLSQCRGDWERSQSVRMDNGECSQCSFLLAGSALYRSGLEWGALPIQRNRHFGVRPL
jgi:hypothetical protein